MRRFTRSFRTRKNIRHTSALRDQFLRELSREAEALLKQMHEQFAQSLQAQFAQLSQGIVAGDRPIATAPSGNDVGAFGGIGQLLSTGVRYLISRPSKRRDTVESSRSMVVGTNFRLSQSQMAAEMQSVLGRGEKNS